MNLPPEIRVSFMLKPRWVLEPVLSYGCWTRRIRKGHFCNRTLLCLAVFRMAQRHTKRKASCLQSIRKCTERPIINYIGGYIRLGRHAADGNNGEGCKPSFSFLLWCRFIEFKWLRKSSVVPVYPVDGLYFRMKLFERCYKSLLWRQWAPTDRPWWLWLALARTTDAWHKAW